MSVKPFHLVEKFNHELVGVPKREFKTRLDIDEYDWLREVLSEEMGEFIGSYYSDDFIGQVDALIDLIYFAMGGLTRLGVTADEAEAVFYAVHEKNMLKKAGSKGRGSELDATKPESWEGPEAEIKRILEK